MEICFPFIMYMPLKYLDFSCGCSVTKLCPILWDPMNTNVPRFTILHYLPEFAQTHVHQVSDAIQLSHPLSPPSPLALSSSQHQDLFQWVGSSHQVAKVLELQLQHQFFQWIFSTHFLYDWLVGSPCSPKDSQRVFSNTTVQKHPFFDAQLSSQSHSRIHTWSLEKS